MAPRGTRERILDHAERLFAEQGYDRASLRSITEAADVNLAAVNYHFGSKEALVHAVIARRFQPLNEERLALLDALEARGEPTLEGVVRAFVEPVVRVQEGEDAQQVARVAKLLMQISTMSEELSCEHKRLFQRTGERFIPAFLRALPDLDPHAVFWRINFMVAVVAMSFSDAGRLKFISRGACDSADTDEAIAQIVAFLAAGFRAPAPQPKAQP